MNPECIAVRLEKASSLHERALKQLMEMLEQYKSLEELLVECNRKIDTCTNPVRKAELQQCAAEIKAVLQDVEQNTQESLNTVQGAAELKAFMEGVLQVSQN